MNTINGNFIEKSIPNIKNTTLNVNIGGVDATMTVEKFAASLPAPASTINYKSYVALITQTGTAAPVATVIENTLGGAVIWSRSATGQYVGTLTSAFTTGKTACFVTSKTANDYVSQYDYFLESSNTNNINLTSVSITGAEDGLLLNKIIEIRVYN